MTLTPGQRIALIARYKVFGRKQQRGYEVAEDFDPAELPDYGWLAELLIANGTLDEADVAERLVADLETKVN